MAQRPTTLNSMTHFALTDTQGEVLGGDGEELRKALRETGAEEVKSRFQAAVDAGLIAANPIELPGIDNTLPPEEQTQTQTHRDEKKEEQKPTQQDKREERHDDKRGR